MVSPQQEKKQEVTGWAGLGWLHPLMFEPRTFQGGKCFSWPAGRPDMCSCPLSSHPWLQGEAEEPAGKGRRPLARGCGSAPSTLALGKGARGGAMVSPGNSW